MVGEGRFGLLGVAVHDRQNAKGRDEHGEELAELPVELEEPHRDDVREEGVRVPDRGDVAESCVVTRNVNAYLSGKNDRHLRCQRHACKPEQGGQCEAKRQEGRQTKKASVWEGRPQGNEVALAGGSELNLDGERQACYERFRGCRRGEDEIY